MGVAARLGSFAFFIGVWVAMMIALTLVNYAVPIAELASQKLASVPVIPIGSR